jgi:hypothetical protein
MGEVMEKGRRRAPFASRSGRESDEMFASVAEIGRSAGEVVRR